MITMKDIPCYNCICMAICRQKEFQKVMSECPLVREVLYLDGMKIADSRYRKPGFKRRIHLIEEALNPLHWELQVNPLSDNIQVIGINLEDL